MRLPSRRLRVEQRPHRVHVRQHARRDVRQLVADRLARSISGNAKPAPQRVVMGQQPFDLAVERRRGRRGPSGGWRAGRPCPRRPGRCRGGSCRCVSPRLADSRMASSSRCSDRISVTFSAIRRLSGVTVDALRRELVDLFDQRVRVEHDAVADDRQLAGPHDAGRQQRQLVGRCRRSPACGRRYGRPGSGRRCRPARTASRRSCPCPRRPTGSRPRPRSP